MGSDSDLFLPHKPYKDCRNKLLRAFGASFAFPAHSLRLYRDFWWILSLGPFLRHFVLDNGKRYK